MDPTQHTGVGSYTGSKFAIPATEPCTTLLHADWYALRLLNLFRLFLLAAFASTFLLAEGFDMLGSRSPDLFGQTLGIWTILAVCFYVAMRRKKPTLEIQFYLQIYCDIVCLVTLMYASGGVASNLGVLLLIHIAIIANFTLTRYTILFAAIATALTFAEELFAALTFGSWAARLTEAAVLGTSLFGVALITTALVHRQQRQSLSSPVTRLSNEQLKELKEEIVEEIDSGVLHVDEHDHVQLINTKGQGLLGIDKPSLPVHIAQLSPPLWASLLKWRSSHDTAMTALDDPALKTQLLPHFVNLSNGRLLIRIDDQTDIATRLQQLKQASLGRMSSSIAHEIRNPLGAISNAVQLLAESRHLDAEDHKLIDIAHKHTLRINRIIEDVMQLSARGNSHPEQVVLEQFLQSLSERFIQQNSQHQQVIDLQVHETATCTFDAHHLDQVVWNLCSNALLHNESDQPRIELHLYSANGGHPILDICDNGKGIAADSREMIFEPFYTTRTSTGLGLFICRELCLQNNATLEYIPISNGSCFRLTLCPAEYRSNETYNGLDKAA